MAAYLRGLQNALTDPYDDPDLAKAFLFHAADLLVQFDQRIRSILDAQENFGGCWIVSGWAPAQTLYFSEHTTVNYSPEIYREFVQPANARMLDGYPCALTYLYVNEGIHLKDEYFRRGRPIWVNTCGGDPPADVVREFSGEDYFTIRASAETFEQLLSQYGSRGIAYEVTCGSLEQAQHLCGTLKRQGGRPPASYCSSHRECKMS